MNYLLHLAKEADFNKLKYRNYDHAGKIGNPGACGLNEKKVRLPFREQYTKGYQGQIFYLFFRSDIR